MGRLAADTAAVAAKNLSKLLVMNAEQLYAGAAAHIGDMLHVLPL